jgi:anti-sigma28 factor (negative regulator of flagellin synthesis)
MYKNTNKPPKEFVNESDKVSNILAFNENVSQIDDAKRINHLKLAIDKGNYNINPLRVAEKFIQFESQLSS